jgi:hypothetical protein
MIDLEGIRRDISTVALRTSEALRDHDPEFVNSAIECDALWRRVRAACDSLRSQRKALTKEIRDKIKSNRKDEAQDDINLSKKLALQVVEVDKTVKDARLQLEKSLSFIGNYPIITSNDKDYYTSDNVLALQKKCVPHIKNVANICEPLLLHILTYFKQQHYVPVDIPSSPAKQEQKSELCGALLSEYTSVWVPESALPLRYASLNRSTNNLDLSVLCHPSNSAETFANVVRSTVEYFQLHCAQWAVKSVEPSQLEMSAVCQTLFACSSEQNNKQAESQWMAQCYNYTDYHSRALEVRCGHGKGHGPSGSTKKYVHLVRCVISLDVLSKCCVQQCVDDLLSLEKDTPKHVSLFGPLIVMKTGMNNPSTVATTSKGVRIKNATDSKSKSKSKSKGKGKGKDKDKGKSSHLNNQNNHNGRSMAGKRQRQVGKTKRATTKLCTQEGIASLINIFTQQSFLCGAGWVATQEDVVVFARLESFVHYLVHLEVERFDEVVKNKDSSKDSNRASIQKQVDDMKSALKSSHGRSTLLESRLKRLCSELGISIVHSLTDATLWFDGKNAFWRWYRCMNALGSQQRERLLPTMEHLKSGRVSLLFDL